MLATVRGLDDDPPLHPMRSSPLFVSPSRIVASAAIAACVLLSAGSARADTEVTCGETLSGSGFLAAGCTGTITITKGKLDMRGFSVAGAGLAAIDCQSLCKISGPGTISSSGSAFGVLGGGRVTVSDVTISGHNTAGVKAGETGGVNVRNSTISNNGSGVTGPRVKLRDSFVIDNTGSGVVSTTGARVKRSTVSGNGKNGVSTDVSPTESGKANLVDSVVTDNGEFGVFAKKIRFKATDVIDNSQDADCGDTIPCADLGSVQIPQYSGGSTCGTSMMVPEEFTPPLPFGDTWGVCLNDFFP